VRIVIAAVGRLKSGPLKALEEHYAARITWPLLIRAVEERRKLPAAELRAREAALLRAAVPKGATLVALDERGADLASAAFAERLGRWRDQGVADLAFLIGGADGLDAALGGEAELVLALGRMTWPHLLARGLLLEQLYRAQQILAGHPYHRA
jgi:23S rRNA (pseudouridine1915-N3)-methyltransferase